MKISQSSQYLTSLLATSSPREPGSTRASQVETETPSTLVALSAVSRQLQELQQDERPAEQIDTARVQALCVAIAAGELPIDSGRIAAGLIDNACELLHPVTR